MTTSALKIETHNQYRSPPFGPASVDPDPLVQFRAWFHDAQTPSNPEQGSSSASNPTFTPKPKVLEPEAMSLATASSSGVPSTRMVLLKEVDSKGFVFFTNYSSRKGQELSENPHAALGFYWREMHRQVRVVGTVEKLDADASNRYYHSRPLVSQLGARASPQSQVIQEGELAERLKGVEDEFGVGGAEQKEIPRPDFWGGFRVVPREVEFWSGKPNRLHDRVVYRRQLDEAQWIIQRLAP